jgi:Short C-terminal domain
MPLLSSMMRLDAFSGRTDAVDAWLAGRQTWRWAPPGARAGWVPAQRTHATPTESPADADDRLRELAELHSRGVVSDAEFERLRTRVSA